MAHFIQEISNFTRLGTYHYRFDEVGNDILNPSSSIFQETYFSFPLTVVNYDQSKVLSFYDPTFTEFVKPADEPVAGIETVEDIRQALNEARNDKAQLQTQLDELIAKSELSSTEATENVIKEILISLRIQLGQGQIVADFNTDFPYLPLPPEEQPSNQS